MLTHKEATEGLRRHRELETPIVKVYATARPGHEDVTEARFPGVTHTGYIIADPLAVLGWSDWLDIERIEKW